LLYGAADSYARTGGNENLTAAGLPAHGAGRGSTLPPDQGGAASVRGGLSAA